MLAAVPMFYHSVYSGTRKASIWPNPGCFKFMGLIDSEDEQINSHKKTDKALTVSHPQEIWKNSFSSHKFSSLSDFFSDLYSSSVPSQVEQRWSV